MTSKSPFKWRHFLPYLNNLVEQDHRFIKRLTKSGMVFVTVNTARRTLKGFEAMNMGTHWASSGYC
jgi:transposase-like protein